MRSIAASDCGLPLANPTTLSAVMMVMLANERVRLDAASSPASSRCGILPLSHALETHYVSPPASSAEAGFAHERRSGAETSERDMTDLQKWIASFALTAVLVG